MKRIYFLTPNITSTKSIVAELREHDITDAQIHVVGKAHDQIERANIPEANLLHTTDLVHSMEKGAIAGGTMGLIAGLAAVTFPPAGLVLGGGAILGLGLFGTGFGAWVSSMIGISIPDETVEKYESAIHKGQFLLIVDIPKDNETKIVKMIKSHHPEAKIEGSDLPANSKKKA